MIDFQDNHISEIAKNFPEINIKKYYFIETGWMNRIIIINDRIVFRFPRTGSGITRLSSELKLLSILKRTTVRLPEYKFIHMVDPFFAGYEMIHGDTIDMAKSLGKGVLNDFISLLDYMHQFNRGSFSETSLHIYNSKTWIGHEESLLDSFRKALEYYTGHEYFDGIFILMDLALSDLMDSDISLIHGDLSRGNVILNRKHSRINGVIDWSDSSYGDRALDVAAIIDGFSLKYLPYVLNHFSMDFSSRALKRVFFYRMVSPLYKAYFLEKTGKHIEAERLCTDIINNSEYKKLGNEIKSGSGNSKFILP